MTDIDAKAREIALSRHTTDDAYADAIAAALLSVRNEALEEAARVLLREAKELKEGPGYWDDEIQDYERLADAIRALKQEG